MCFRSRPQTRKDKKEGNLPYGCHAQWRFSVWDDNAGVTNPESKGNRHVQYYEGEKETVKVIINTG